MFRWTGDIEFDLRTTNTQQIYTLRISLPGTTIHRTTVTQNSSKTLRHEVSESRRQKTSVWGGLYIWERGIVGAIPTSSCLSEATPTGNKHVYTPAHGYQIYTKTIQIHRISQGHNNIYIYANALAKYMYIKDISSVILVLSERVWIFDLLIFYTLKYVFRNLMCFCN